MTPEERSEVLATIANAIREAIASEREAIATMVDEMYPEDGIVRTETLTEIAAAIRARKT